MTLSKAWFTSLLLLLLWLLFVVVLKMGKYYGTNDIPALKSPGEKRWYYLTADFFFLNKCVNLSNVLWHACRLQCGLVGSWRANVRDDGGPVALWHRGELWQPRPEHRRLPLPRWHTPSRCWIDALLIAPSTRHKPSVAGKCVNSVFSPVTALSKCFLCI